MKFVYQIELKYVDRLSEKEMNKYKPQSPQFGDCSGIPKCVSNNQLDSRHIDAWDTPSPARSLSYGI